MIVGDDFGYMFRQIGIYSIEVMMEQMSKAGAAVQKAMRQAMKSKVVYTRSYKRSLVQSSPRAFGAREDINTGDDLSPENMENFVNSFVAERSYQVIVGGAHPSFTPLKRRNGKIVGTYGKVKGVGSRTAAILRRMNDGYISPDYPKKSQLSKKDIGTGWAQTGVSMAMPQVNHYLKEGYDSVFKKAMNNANPRKVSYGT